MRAYLLTRLVFAVAALLGTAVPVVPLIAWPDDLDFFSATVGGLLVPLALYVLLVHSRAAVLGTGIALVLIAGGLPVPVYPFSFGHEAGGFAVQGLVFLLVPPLAMLAWVIGFIVDVSLRPGRRPVPSPLATQTPPVTQTLQRPASTGEDAGL